MTSVVIVGGGPGGYEAALVARQLGADVTLVDRDGPGGSAVLTDCVPEQGAHRHRQRHHEASTSAGLGVLIHGLHARPVAGRRRPRGRERAHQGARRAQSADIRTRLDLDGHPRSSPAPGASTMPDASSSLGSDGRQRGAARRRRRAPATGARPRVLPEAHARRRAHPHVGAGLRPRRGSRAAHRRRIRRHRRGVRRRLPRARQPRRPHLLARPRPAQRGSGRRRACSRRSTARRGLEVLGRPAPSRPAAPTTASR